MKCPRCNGLIVSQALVHALSDPESWKCLNCGNVLCPKERTLEFDNFSLFHHQQKIKKR